MQKWRFGDLENSLSPTGVIRKYAFENKLVKDDVKQVLFVGAF